MILINGLPMVFLTWLRSPRIADGASQAVQAVSLKPFACPLLGPPGVQVAAIAPNHPGSAVDVIV